MKGKLTAHILTKNRDPERVAVTVVVVVVIAVVTVEVIIVVESVLTLIVCEKKILIFLTKE